MEGKRFGTVVVLTALLLFCGSGEKPTAPEPAPTPEPTPESTPKAAPDPTPVANPFGLANVPDFDDQEVQFYAAVAQIAGDAEDENAAQWSEVGKAGSYDSIDGEWSSRWNADPPNEEWHPGTAKIKSVGDRVFIHFQGGFEYSLETVRQGDRLVGRYVALADAKVTLPWVGLVVSNERIDGVWPLGRWDFRRGGQAATEEKKP